jgi:MoxR-like ATPase
MKMNEKKDNRLDSLLKRLGKIDFEQLKKEGQDQPTVTEEQELLPPVHTPSAKTAEAAPDKANKEQTPLPPLTEKSPRQTSDEATISAILERLQTGLPQTPAPPQEPPLRTSPPASPEPLDRPETVTDAVRPQKRLQISLPQKTLESARTDSLVSAFLPLERSRDEELEKDLAVVSDLYGKMGTKIGELVVGHRPLIHLLFVALIAEGHILIEGAPGTGKTLIAKTVAQLSGCTFRRIQGMADILPADILGTRVYDPKKKGFLLREGPIFSHFLLIDEINRLSPKTQSALIEAMSEEQVTIDGITRELPRPFIVMATQNPYESDGTFPLIETQKVRFMFSTRLSHLSRDGEIHLTERADAGALEWGEYYRSLIPIADRESLSRCTAIARRMHVEKPLLNYITDLVITTRSHGAVRMGASARASIALVKAGKAVAALENRPYVTIDDIRHIAPAVLQHRLVLKQEAVMRGVTTEQVIQEIFNRIGVP